MDKGSWVYRGSRGGFAKFLRKIKACDDKQDPRSFRKLTYTSIADEIISGEDPVIWVWDYMLKALGKRQWGDDDFDMEESVVSAVRVSEAVSEAFTNWPGLLSSLMGYMGRSVKVNCYGNSFVLNLVGRLTVGKNDILIVDSRDIFVRLQSFGFMKATFEDRYLVIDYKDYQVSVGLA
ncbi:MAG: hypothetical protein GF311_28420 [Candidatus Lokiarchaeota archaeon]|nr:hypothetical protein [Candidatus Lokiarchaeota archaeon]